MKKIIFVISTLIFTSVLYAHQKQDEEENGFTKKEREEFIEMAEKLKKQEKQKTKNGKIREIRGKN